MLRVDVTGRVTQSVAALPGLRGRRGQDDAAAPSLGSLHNVWSQRTRRARGASVREPALGCARYAREESRSSNGVAMWSSPGVIRHIGPFFSPRKSLAHLPMPLRWRDLEDTPRRTFFASETSRPA